LRYRFARQAETLGKSVYDHAPGAIMLSAGSAYPMSLPDVSHEAAEAARHKEETMQYGPLMGLDDLRDCIAAYVAEDGVTCSRENILATNGAKHATELALRVFTEAGDRIIVSAPTYMTTLQTFRNYGLNLLGVPQDVEGLDADLLETRLRTLRDNGEPLPKLLFDIPDFHNPTGITMSLERRKRLIELALEYEFVIVEDDPYRRLRFEGEPVPPIKSLDTEGIVIAVGTVSKILSPGLRVGWAIAAPEIVKRMALQKSDGGSSPFNQRIVASLMRSNKMGLHIAEVSQHMKAHRDAMIDALATALPGATVRKPEGGYFLWVELPEGMSGDALAARGVAHGVEVSPGRVCFPTAAAGNYLRLAYSFVGPDTIRDGIRRLGIAYKELL
tara:strand:+ start:846 stop:2006 length:1161 start_codon:yes stop_codon:yes gene_type:complete